MNNLQYYYKHGKKDQAVLYLRINNIAALALAKDNFADNENKPWVLLELHPETTEKGDVHGFRGGYYELLTHAEEEIKQIAKWLGIKYLGRI